MLTCPKAKANTTEGQILEQLPRVSKGFTVVELLVVIAIIVLLLALLAPSMDRTITAAVNAKCAAHQHQLLNIFVQYGTENRRKFPSGKRDNDNVEHAIFVSSDFVKLIESHSGNNKTERASSGGFHFGVVPQLLVDPSYKDFGYKSDVWGYVIGFLYLGGHPLLTTANADTGWQSPVSLSSQGSGKILTCLNTWAPGTGTDATGPLTGFWSVSAHTAGGPLGEDNDVNAYFYKGPGSGGDTKDLGATGGNISFTDGAVQWNNIDETEVYFSSSGKAFPARW